MSAWLFGSLAAVLAGALAAATPIAAQPRDSKPDTAGHSLVATPAADEVAQVELGADAPNKALGAAATPEAGLGAGAAEGALPADLQSEVGDPHTEAGAIVPGDASDESTAPDGVDALDQRCGSGNGRIDPAWEAEYWYFDAQAGETVVIKVIRTSGNLDGWLSLFDPYGNEIAYDDDSGGNYNPMIRRSLSVSGQYRIRVSSYVAASTGDYRVEVCWSAQSTCPDSQYTAQYFNNMSLSGSPAVTRCEGWPIDHDWSGGRPVDGIGDNNFSVRWTGRANIAEGTYRFIARSDDGIRVWVGGQLIIDAWRDQAPTEHGRVLRVASGTYDLRIEYYENGGGAVAQFRWVRVVDPPICQGTPVNIMSAVTGYIGSGGARSYCFPGDGGRWVSIRAVAQSEGAYPGPGGLDPVLRLYDPRGQRIGENDDAFGYNTNAMLVAYLPESGMYRLEISGYGSTSGNYRMHLGLNRKATVADANSTCDVGEGDRWLVEHFFGQSSYNDERLHADINLDGMVNSVDYAYVMIHWGRRCP
jgi:hypothetical protein